MKKQITAIAISLLIIVSCGKKNQTTQSNNSSQTTSTVTDIDGNVYPTITIGTQTWMAKNLNVTKYRTGEIIPHVTDMNQWQTQTTSAYCNYENIETNSILNGKLYNWYAIKDGKNIAPIGWHVANQNDWLILSAYLGGSQVAGKKLKETGTAHWEAPNSGTNDVGFNGLGSGIRNFNYSDQFEGIKEYTFWWGDPDVNMSSWALGYGATASHDTLIGGVLTKQAGLSVRCVKD